MKRCIKLLTIFSLAFILLAFFHISVSAADASGKCGDNLTWKWVYDGRLYIEGTGNMYEYTTYNIPWKSYSIKSVAFNGDINSICDNAFKNQTSIERIYIQGYIRNIGQDAFYNCSKLKYVYVYDTNYWYNIKFENCHSNPLTNDGGLYFLYDYYDDNGEVYQSYSLVDEITIPDSVTEISDYAFYKCSSLKKVNMSNKITKIGKEAFYYCRSAYDINIPNSIKTIGDSAFYGCKMNNIVIPNTIEYIGKRAFMGCNSVVNFTTPFIGSKIDDAENTRLVYFFGTVPETLKNVTITGGEIYESAFSGCSNIEFISLPESITKIHNNTFNGCYRLKSIKLPSNLQQVGSNAFAGCENLTNIYISNENVLYNIIYSDWTSHPFAYSNKGNIYVNDTLITTIRIPESIEKINAFAFYNCTGIENVILSDSVKKIEERAFYGCTELKKINIPLSVTTIDFATFMGCVNLSDILLHDNIIIIDNRAFENCKSIQQISLSNNMERIGSNAFASCDSLLDVNIFSVQEIEESAFSNCSSIKKVVISNGINKISKNTFYYCDKLEDITLPDSVSSIGENAFYNCSSLKQIYVPSNLSAIDKYAFYNCNSLTNFTIPTKTETIGDYAFAYCENLQNIVIPSNIKTIGNYAFSNCTKFDNIIIPQTVWTIGKGSFYNCNNLRSITLPFLAGFDYYLGYIFGADSYSENATYVPATLKEVILTDAIYIGDYAFSECGNIETIVIPNTVASIGKHALKGCNKLTNLTVPFIGVKTYEITDHHLAALFGDYRYSYYSSTYNIPSTLKNVTITGTVENIGSYAFSCSRIENLVMPKGVKSIDEYAFRSCSDLKNIYIDNIDDWCNISFYNKESNPLSVAYGTQLYANNSLVSNLVIPNNISSMPKYAFNGCDSIITVQIGKNITSIGDYAFEDCSEIKLIYYDGTKTEWNNISLGYRWDSNAGSNTANKKYALITASVGIEYSLNVDKNSYSAMIIGVPENETLNIPTYYNNLPITNIVILDGIKGNITFSVEKPKKLGYKFKGWSESVNGSVIYKAGETYLGNSASTLYAIWESVPYTTLTVTPRTNFDLIDIELFDLDAGCTVIFAIYKDGKLVNMQNDTYNGETVSFIESNDYDTAKVMVWENLSSLKPLCDVLMVDISQPQI